MPQIKRIECGDNSYRKYLLPQCKKLLSHLVFYIYRSDLCLDTKSLANGRTINTVFSDNSALWVY